MTHEQKKYILENRNKKPIAEIALELRLKEREVRRFLRRWDKDSMDPGAGKEIKKPLQIKILLASIGLIMLLGIISYGNSTTGKFVWDDAILVTGNAHIKSWDNLDKIIREDIGSGANKKSSSYRPMQIFTYMLDYSLWKLDEFGYHITNITLHLLAGLCVFWLILILFDDWLLSLFASLLFVTHPIHAEAVSYISGRADSLAALFILLSLIFYIKQVSAPRAKFYIAALSCYILALLSRENSIILPALALLFHYVFKKKINYRFFFSLVAVTCLYVGLRVIALKDILSVEPVTSTVFQRLPGFFVAVTNYIRLLLVPFDLHMEYGLLLFNFADLKALIGILVVVFSLIFAFHQRNKNKLISFSIFWFFITLFPFSSIYPINAYMAEHWLYLPSIGVFLMLAGGLTFLWRKKGLRVLGTLIAVSLLAFYSYLTIKQNSYWKEPIAFYERTLKYATQSPRLYNDLALGYDKLGKHEEAIAALKKAVEIKPDYGEAYINLGSAYSDMGKYEEAIAAYRKAVEMKPDFDAVYNNLGFTYSRMGKHEEAIDCYMKAIALNPRRDTAYFNLGFAYRDLGKYEDAILSYKKILEFSPDNLNAFSHLGSAYIAMRRNEEAITVLKRALEISPDYALAYDNLAVAYYNEEQYDLAIEYCDKALRLGHKVEPDFSNLIELLRKK